MREQFLNEIYITCTYFKHDFIDLTGIDIELKLGNDLFMYHERPISKTRFILSRRVRNNGPGRGRPCHRRIS